MMTQSVLANDERSTALLEWVTARFLKSCNDNLEVGFSALQRLDSVRYRYKDSYVRTHSFTVSLN